MSKAEKVWQKLRKSTKSLGSVLKAKKVWESLPRGKSMIKCANYYFCSLNAISWCAVQIFWCAIKKIQRAVQILARV